MGTGWLLCAGQRFGEVHRVFVTELGDLLAAAETVGDDESVGIGRLDGGQQTVVGDGFGDFVLVALEAEGSGHAAAAGLNGFDDGTGVAQEGDFVRGSAEDRFVMAVAVDEDALAQESAGGAVGSVLGEKIGEKPDLIVHALRARIVGKELL